MENKTESTNALVRRVGGSRLREAATKLSPTNRQPSARTPKSVASENRERAFKLAKASALDTSVAYALEKATIRAVRDEPDLAFHAQAFLLAQETLDLTLSSDLGELAKRKTAYIVAMTRALASLLAEGLPSLLSPCEHAPVAVLEAEKALQKAKLRKAQDQAAWERAAAGSFYAMVHEMNHLLNDVRPPTALAPEPQLRHSYHTAILVTAFALCVVVVIGPFWIVLDSVTTRGEKARLMSQALVGLLQVLTFFGLNKFARIW